LEDVRSADSGGQVVTMMQTARSWHRYDSATGLGILLCRTTCWSFFLQREVRPVIVIVTDVLAHQSFQLPFIQNDDVVEQIATRTNGPGSQLEQESQQAQHETMLTRMRRANLD